MLTDETERRRKLLPGSHRGGSALNRTLGKLWAQSQQVSRNGEDDKRQETENEVMTALPPHLPRPPAEPSGCLAKGSDRQNIWGSSLKEQNQMWHLGERWLAKASKVTFVPWSKSSSLGHFWGEVNLATRQPSDTLLSPHPRHTQRILLRIPTQGRGAAGGKKNSTYRSCLK